MRFGVLRETLTGERRVPLTPEGARALVARDHLVVVQSNAGSGSGFSDTEYLAAGAAIVYTPREVGAEAEFVLKVHAPSAEEVEQLRPCTTLMAFMQLAGQPAALHEALVAGRCSTLSMELVREGSDEYPIMEPLSAIGGRVAATLAAWHLTQPGNGPGILLGGSPGVPPAVAVVIGGGAAGTAAAAGCAAHGAQVVVLDNDPRRLARVERLLGHTVVTAVATEFHLARFLEQADVVIGAVAVRGEPAPRVLRRSHVRSMKEGALFIDLSIDEGGCSETRRPTTADEPTYECEGVRHICIPNLPSEVARTASRAMASSLLPYLQALSGGLHHALARNLALRHAVGFLDGKLVNRALRRFVSVPYVSLDEIVKMVED